MTAATNILADYITAGTDGPRDNTPSAILTPLVAIDCEQGGMVCRFALYWRYVSDAPVRCLGVLQPKRSSHYTMMTIRQADGRVSTPRAVTIKQAQQAIDTYKGAVVYTAKMDTDNNAPLAAL